MIDPMPRRDVDMPPSAEVMQERAAVVRWLRDCATDCPIPQVAQMFQHEADGIEKGLHRIESKEGE